MITIWVPKRLVEIDLYNVAARSPQALADLSERSYAQRVDYAAQKIQLSGAKIVMLTGPSASGKTTSAHCIAKALEKRGTPARVLWGKRVVVFVLWTISMVFFRVGSGNLSGMAENLGVGDAFVYLGRCLMNSWSPARFAGELYSTAYTGFYANTIMVAAYWTFAALALALGIWLDHRRNFACKNKPAEVALASAKHRNALYVVLIVFILVGYIMQSGGFNANAFGPYAGF